MVKNNKTLNQNGTAKQKNHQNGGGLLKKVKNDPAIIAGKNKGKQNLIKLHLNKEKTEIKKKQMEQNNTKRKLLKQIPVQDENENSESDNDEEMGEIASDLEMNTPDSGSEDDNDESDDAIEEENEIVERDDNDIEKVVSKHINKNKAINSSSVKNTSKVGKKPKIREHKLMVNNLPMDTTFPDVVQLFSDSGAIEKVIISNPETFEFGLKKTDSLRAIIIFRSVDAISKALQYNETEFKGRQILLTTNNLKQNDDMQKKQKKIRFQPNVSVFIRNIKPGTTEEQIKEFFSSCGEVKDIQIKENGLAACARFATTQSILAALALNNTTLNDSKVWIIRYKILTPKNIALKFKKHSSLHSSKFENDLIKKIENNIMLKLKNQKKL